MVTALGLCLAVAAAATCKRDATAARATSRPNVVLITLDTTRADRLGCYGYASPVSEHLDRLAAQGVLFTRAFSQAAVTPVSHASILTGLEPYEDGLRVMHGVSENQLPTATRTLAEVLCEAGYRTAAFVSAFPVTAHFGLNQGFETFDEDFARGAADPISSQGIVETDRVQRRGGETTDRALRWLADAGSPYFLWVHYFDPHDPKLLPPDEFTARYPQPTGREEDILRAWYDIEIAYMDTQIGRLFLALEEAGRWSDTVIVAVADHGEGLGDHDWWTHGILYQEQIRVPLIIRAPGRNPATRVDHLVRTIDIMPTVLALAGVDQAQWPRMSGQSFLPLLDGKGSDPGNVAYADSVNRLTYTFTPAIRDVKDEMLFAVVDRFYRVLIEYSENVMLHQEVRASQKRP